MLKHNLVILVLLSLFANGMCLELRAETSEAAAITGARRFPVVNIWRGTSVKDKVWLTPHIASPSGSPAVIVCPGGSYFWHDTKNEGTLVAEWLQKNGISAFVLNYRTANVSSYMFRTRLFVRGHRYPDPQEDLQQAILHVKDNAGVYGIDTALVGAMGFSAGGHLVMSVAEKYTSLRSRPSFVVPVYPVVSFAAECTHKRSRRGLLGDDDRNNRELIEKLSLEKHVPKDCPPVFLVNCKDDPIVDYRNSVLLDSALTSQNVEHVYLQYETGGHGFGASETKGTEECREWKREFIIWFKNLFAR